MNDTLTDGLSMKNKEDENLVKSLKDRIDLYFKCGSTDPVSVLTFGSLRVALDDAHTVHMSDNCDVPFLSIDRVVDFYLVSPRRVVYQLHDEFLSKGFCNITVLGCQPELRYRSIEPGVFVFYTVADRHELRWLVLKSVIDRADIVTVPSTILEGDLSRGLLEITDQNFNGSSIDFLYMFIDLL